MINHRCINCIKQYVLNPGADVLSDHNPIVMKMDILMNKLKKPTLKEQVDVNMLKHKECRLSINVKVTHNDDMMYIEENSGSKRGRH